MTAGGALLEWVQGWRLWWWRRSSTDSTSTAALAARLITHAKLLSRRLLRAEDVDLSTLGTRGLNTHLYLLGGAQHYFPSVVAGLRANREAAGDGETRVEEQVVEVEKKIGRAHV